MTAAILLSEMIAALIASLLMDINIWLPLTAGFATQVIGVVVAAFALPETLPSPTFDVTIQSAINENPEYSKSGLQIWRSTKASFEFLFRDNAAAFLVVGFLVLKTWSAVNGHLTFHVGLQLGGNWIGLPFLFAAVMFIITGLPVFIARMAPKSRPVEESSSQE